MEVVIVPDADDVGRLGADVVEHLVRSTDRPVLGVATGSSPLPVYRELVRRHGEGLSFAGATMFLLDEYVGLTDSEPQAYRTFIRRNLTEQVDVSPDAVHGPDGTADDLEGACARYEELIAGSGGIDLQLLGIGSDGHIGFNEPSSSLGSRTRIKTLTRQTRRDNARFFDGDLALVPHHVLTQGIGTILDARHVVLVAAGATKAAPVALAIEGPVTAMVPASALQLHPHATFVIDEAAAADLTLADYFRDTYADKPSWQGL